MKLTLILALLLLLSGCSDREIQAEDTSGADSMETIDTQENDSASVDTTEQLDFRTDFQAVTGGKLTLEQCVEQYNRLYNTVITADDVTNVEPNGGYFILFIGDDFVYFNKDVSLSDPVELPDGEPLFDYNVFSSNVKLRYYENDGTKFYWTIDRETWYDSTINMPKGVENAQIAELGSGGGSGEGMIYLEAEVNGEKKYYMSYSYTHVLPVVFSDAEEMDEDWISEIFGDK